MSLLLVIFTLPIGCQPDLDPAASAEAKRAISPADAAASHDRMLAAVAAIRGRIDEDHLFLGEGSLEGLRSAFESLNDNTPMRRRWLAHRNLGLAELRQGNLKVAQTQLQNAFRLLPQLNQSISRSEAFDTVFELAMSYVREAETKNCVHCQTCQSCILPIEGSGRHRYPEAARKAILYLEESLRVWPAHGSSIWLLNIMHMTLGSYPEALGPTKLIPTESFKSDTSFPRFTDIAAKVGLNDRNLMGGMVVDDFDGDGLLDVVTSSWDPKDDLIFHRNLGDQGFENRSQAAGFEGIAGGLNLIQADYDNDGDLDLYVLRGAWLGRLGCQPNSLLRNRGDGSFEDVTFAAGLARQNFPSQTADWADFDLDGDLDLYVGNESSKSNRFPSQLFRNNGDGTFTDIAKAAGVENLRSAKGVVWGDYDGDGDPDLYVSNLDHLNRLYRNDGNGRFSDVATELGVQGPTTSFPTWFWDFDNDGNLDLFVSGYTPYVDKVAASHMGFSPPKVSRHALYQNDGQGGFRNVAESFGLGKVTAPMGANYGDLDQDGFPDFYLGTGYPKLEALMPNLMYRNQRGRGFNEVSFAGGFSHLQKGHAIAFADFDGDGDQDVFTQLGGAFPVDAFSNALFENPGFGGHTVVVKLIGTHSNRSGLGAKICAHIQEDGKARKVWGHVDTGGSFGANPVDCHIGLGTATRIVKLEIVWPRAGTQAERTEVFEDLGVDQVLLITEGNAEITRRPFANPSAK